MPGGNVTIYDIASDAGVSIATVSRVLRGEQNVSAATKEKVQLAIERRNYRPSFIARGLTSKTTHSLGIILPKLLNPHYAMLFTGAQEEARKLAEEQARKQAEEQAKKQVEEQRKQIGCL